MATVLERPETLPDEDEVRDAPLLRRPSKNSGVVGWLTGVDHKKVGILYGITAMFFFVVGGVEALIIRLQLAQPEQSIVSADTFNQLFTMHGTTMIFLVVM
ncbi:MAG: cbb3-type cytochrome c oxidase subunit I, partial [Acidimicrobiia bacterium]